MAGLVEVARKSYHRAKRVRLNQCLRRRSLISSLEIAADRLYEV